MSKPIVAIMYDFDKTLCTRDMQEYTFIPSVGMEPHEFWNHTAEVAAQEVMDSILTYLYCMVETAKQSGNPLTRDSLVACGKVRAHQSLRRGSRRPGGALCAVLRFEGDHRGHLHREVL